MPYRELYRRRQHVAADYLPRQWYVDDALELQWVNGITLRATPQLPQSALLGFIVKHNANFLNGLQDNYTIVVADQLPPELERFVTIKELMHCYFTDGDGTATDSELILEAHLRQFFGNSATSPSAHVQAEYTAYWMAVGVLCREASRRHFKIEVAEQRMQIGEVAGQLRIPVGVAKQLLSEQFDDELRQILA